MNDTLDLIWQLDKSKLKELIFYPYDYLLAWQWGDPQELLKSDDTVYKKLWVYFDLL